MYLKSSPEVYIEMERFAAGCLCLSDITLEAHHVLHVFSSHDTTECINDFVLFRALACWHSLQFS